MAGTINQRVVQGSNQRNAQQSLIFSSQMSVLVPPGSGSHSLDYLRDGNLILIALSIGRVTLINAAKNQQFPLAQDSLTLTWGSANFHPAIFEEE